MKIRLAIALLFCSAAFVGCGADTSIQEPDGPVEAAPSTLSEKAGDDNQSTPTAPAMID